MRILIHPLDPQHHAATEALILDAAPERRECIQQWSVTPLEPAPEEYVRRDYMAVTAETPDAVIAYGSIWPQREGRFRMDLIVSPEWRNQGIGSALLRHLRDELRSQNAVIVQARTRDDRPESMSFLTRRGFTETNRMIQLRLNLADASTAGLSAQTDRLAAQGITITTLEREQERITDYRALGVALLQAANHERVDNPYRTGSDAGWINTEDAARTWDGYMPLSPDACFLARYGEIYVGLSYLVYVDESNTVRQGDTAVHVDWRHHGIATLLKLHTIDYALKHGYSGIGTCTASPGMLAVNERVGFTREWSDVRLIKKIEKH